MLYLDNLDASVAVLRKLSNEWKEHSAKHSTVDPLRETLKSFRQKVMHSHKCCGSRTLAATCFFSILLYMFSWFFDQSELRLNQY